MSSFSDRQLVIGDLNGVRTFRLGEKGKLVSPVYKATLEPGINAAVCQTTSSTLTFSSIGFPIMRQDKPDAAPSTHQVANKDCTCGWYAYTNLQANPHHVDGTHVLTIVRGSGVCTVGQLGFKAEKIELLAVVRPKSNQRRSPRARFLQLLVAFWAAMLIFEIVCASRSDFLSWDFWTYTVCAVMYGTLLFLYTRTALGNAMQGYNERAIRKRYPDAKFFDTPAQAAAEFPIQSVSE